MFKYHYKLPFVENWHHGYISEAMHETQNGNITRGIINIPPSYGKTESTVKMGSSWMMGHNPSLKVIHTSYSSELSTKNSYQTRDLVSSQSYKNIFPNTIISKDQDQKHFWETTAKGGMFATGTGGAVTGFHSHGIFIDDPTKAIEAHSKSAQNEAIDYLEGSLYSRLQDKKNGFIWLIMQRLDPNDLTGHLLEQGDWFHLNLKALESRPIVYDLGRFHYEREANEPLWEDYEDYDGLKIQEKAMGSKFASQYLQDPETLIGDFYTDDDFTIIGEFDIPQNENLYTIIDPAMSTKKTADNRAIVTVGKSIDKQKLELIIVHDVKYGTWTMSDFIENIIDTMIQYPSSAFFIELSGGGILVHQELSKEIIRKNVILKEQKREVIKNRVVTYSPKRAIKKNEKLQAMQPYFKSHQIKFKRGASGIDQLKKELRSFNPNKDSPKDDCMECLAESITNEKIIGKKPKKIKQKIARRHELRSSSSTVWRI
jgi:hypothetical protein